MKRPKSRACIVDSDRNGVRVEVCPEAGDIVVTAYRDETIVGQAVLDVHQPVHGMLKVGEVEVKDSERRSGIGTRLYEAATRIGCKAGLPLASDSFRSPYAEAFWRKQESRGRAVCERGEGEVYVGPVRGRSQEGLPKPVIGEKGDPVWPCERYLVRAPCEVPSLAGVKRRRR